MTTRRTRSSTICVGFMTSTHVKGVKHEEAIPRTRWTTATPIVIRCQGGSRSLLRRERSEGFSASRPPKLLWTSQERLAIVRHPVEGTGALRPARYDHDGTCAAGVDGVRSGSCGVCGGRREAALRDAEPLQPAAPGKAGARLARTRLAGRSHAGQPGGTETAAG